MESKQPTQSGEYWKKHVMSWEAGAYYKDGGRTPQFWDRVAALFRGNGMYVRMDAAVRLAAPRVKGLTVLDIGCGSGRFAIKLLEAGAQRVIGVDISPAAIEAANGRRVQSPYEDRLEFKVADLSQPDIALPAVDLITAMGVIEYFDAPALDRLLGKFKARYFLLDFPDAQGRTRSWFIWNLRQVYLRIYRCPGVYLYRPDTFRTMAAQHGFSDLRFVRHSIFDYVTNLPDK
jgi:cyclopropane fatty-acyl-phospholipid synthase-like methyltransferase